VRNYRVTGPVEVSPAAAAASTKPMISHRSDQFRELFGRVTAGLGTLFGTAAPVLPLTCSGTGGLEAVACSLLRPGDRVLSVQAGHFGERFAHLAAHAGADVDVLAAPWGQAVAPEHVAERAGGYDAVLFTHNETSTGVLGPLRDWAEATRAASEALILVDIVSSLAATPIAFDKLGLDAAVGVTQKALACPPGLALIALSDRAQRRADEPGAGGYYLSLASAGAHARESTTVFTPALTLLYALDAALADIATEGIEQVWQRHTDTAAACRATLAAYGAAPVADEALCSPTVTAVKVPSGSANQVRERLADDYDIWLSGGRGPWKGEFVRIAHMGPVCPHQVTSAAAALAHVTRTRSRPGTTIAVHRNAEDISADWDDLAGALAAPVFAGRDFTRAYERHPIAQITDPCHVEVRASNGTLTGAASAYLQGDPLGLLGLAASEKALLSPVWHCNDSRLLAGDDRSLHLVCDTLRQRAIELGAPQWGFVNVRADAPAVPALLARGMHRADLVPKWSLPRSAAPDADTYLQSLKRSVRHELRRQLNRAADHGTHTVTHRADSPDLVRLLELVAASAARAGSPNYYRPIELAAFLAELDDPVRVLEVAGDTGETLAVGICFVETTRLQYWAAGYVRDRPDVAFSPYYRLWWDVLELMWSLRVPTAECGRLNETFKIRMGLRPQPLIALTEHTR
jgi:aspartate aminotransferase-like enzyme/predicted N-acyltransferase